MIFLATILSGLSLLMSVLLLVRAKIPFLFLLLFPLLAGALSPYWAVLGVVGAVIGWIYTAYWAVAMGTAGAIAMILYVWGNTRGHQEFEKAFGPNWSEQIPAEQAKHMLQKRWSWFLKMKTTPKPSCERNVPFWTIPDTDRQLLCDIWQPANGNVSGLAYVFLHGSAWAVMDKDLGTRPFFSHLTAQGHIVMDIAYRLIPETDIYGMVGDAKRAVAWIKANADRYGVDPEKIVLGGGSAGGHVALLAGYTPEHPKLTPEDLAGVDLSVCGLVTYYPPTNLVPGYESFKVEKFSAKTPAAPIGTKVSSKESFDYAGRLDVLLGGSPDEIPEVYELVNPTTHVCSGSPPTLLMQGNKDILVPFRDTQELYSKLVSAGVPAVNVVFPWTDHAFDLLVPQLSPPAQSALYDIDRFLALLLCGD